MRLEKLYLKNFKNYAEADLEFAHGIHCFLGKNGSGKTNLLDAIYYLAFTKSSTPGTDLTNVRQGEDHFAISGRFYKDETPIEVTCSLTKDGKKLIENGKTVARFSQHIGKYPLVMIAPQDIELIWDGSEVRRRFFDTLFSQQDREYLENLITYQAHLRQRNGLLRMFAEQGRGDKDLIASYDGPLAASGVLLFEKRKELITKFLPRLNSRYAFLVGIQSEMPDIIYQSELAELDFKKELDSRFDLDIRAGRTTLGIHRDDFHFKLNEQELRRFGSQGQQKSFLIAVKLAEFDSLKEKSGFNPLLLLDDIFDKLDDDRIVQLMRLATDGAFGQIFITDARPERSLEILKHAGARSRNFIISAGAVESFPN